MHNRGFKSEIVFWWMHIRFKNICLKMLVFTCIFVYKYILFYNPKFLVYLYIIPSHLIERYTCVIHKKILFTSWIVVQKWSNNKLRLLSNFMIQVVTFPPKLRFRKHNLNINTIPTFTISAPFEVDNHIR